MMPVPLFWLMLACKPSFFKYIYEKDLTVFWWNKERHQKTEKMEMVTRRAFKNALFGPLFYWLSYFPLKTVCLLVHVNVKLSLNTLSSLQQVSLFLCTAIFPTFSLRKHILCTCPIYFITVTCLFTASSRELQLCPHDSVFPIKLRLTSGKQESISILLTAGSSRDLTGAFVSASSLFI